MASIMGQHDSSVMDGHISLTCWPVWHGLDGPSHRLSFFSVHHVGVLSTFPPGGRLPLLSARPVNTLVSIN